MEVKVGVSILEENDRAALELKALLKEHGIYTLNLLGSPGAGKTSLLEQTVKYLRDKISVAVIEGDLYTSKDADRIAAYEIPVVQVNTRGGCHLDAKMVRQALAQLDLEKLDLLIVENVGNLVCPAEFSLGEDAKAVVLSVTEGDDKPLKYPLVFEEASVAVLNKMDLLPYTDFHLENARRDIKSIHSDICIHEVSCRTGEGLDSWYDWLLSQVSNKGN